MLNPIQMAGSAERNARAAEFIAVARHFLEARGDVLLAATRAEAGRATARVGTILKTAVAAGSMTNWASPLVEYQAVMSAFIESLSNAGAFDAMLPFMRRVPLRSRALVVTLGASASTVGSGMVTPISTLQLAGHQIAERKALAILVFNDELLKLADSESFALFGNELRRAIAVETDRTFLSLITSGISTIPSNGGTSIAILQDIDALAGAISTNAASKLFLIVEATTAKKWSFKTTSTGELAFPGMTPQGGEISGVPVIVSDGTPAASLVMVDANQIAAGAGSVELDTSRQADIQFETAPDSPPIATAILKSLWQHNATALKALRYFGAEPLRSTAAVSVISGISNIGNSPA